MYKVYDAVYDYKPIFQSNNANDIAMSLLEVCHKNNWPPQWEYITSYYCVRLDDHCVCYDDLAVQAAFRKLAAESES